MLRQQFVDRNQEEIQIRLRLKEQMEAISQKINLEKYNKVKKTIIDYQKFIKDNFKYVGDNFAYEARSIHYNGKKNQRVFMEVHQRKI